MSVNPPAPPPDAARAMPIHGLEEVTAALVEELWTEAIDGMSSTDDVRDRAETLLDQANAENPVVNWGLTSLYHLTGLPGPGRAALIRAHAAWHTELRRYEADPSAWMRHYYQHMIRAFTRRCGPEKGRAFAAKLVQHGHLHETDVPAEVRE